jgi:hypothetical protein
VTGKPIGQTKIPDIGPGGKMPFQCPDNAFWVEIPPTVPGGSGLVASVIFGNPEQAFVRNQLPMVVLQRSSITPAMNRWNSVGHTDYFHGINPFEYRNSVSGYGIVETKPQAMPFDLNYDVSIYARLETDALKILQRLLRRFPVYGAIPVIDSLGDQRTYSTFLESSVNDVSEIVDVSERIRGYSFSVRVEGELDLYDVDLNPTVAEVEFNVQVGTV